ncbi:NAD(P)/FAD-dependent oxidoreductase [Aeromicrobium sp. Leaf350]|uniref:NAD(P)/FAD-dependent oxidoreductase n=1 Tax=Aeromicrobium sp. Leaf350 TaxID=2876565 RepID=UPI001E3A7C36|nr:FAD-dependent oxidoreductase [Aeromicrobium sp. Leaf350]
MTRLVVVGASLAGLRAVEAARKAGHEGPITLVGDEPHVPYDRPPLSKAYLDEGEPEPTTFREEEHLTGELGVELVLGQGATGLDTERQEVRVGEERVPYDALVVATGARARTLPQAGSLAGVHALRTLDDAVAVRRELDRGVKVVVVGAGFIGSEVASGARKRGLDVTVVEALETPLVRACGEAPGRWIAGLHERHGTRLLCGSGVADLHGSGSDGGGRVEAVELTDGTVLPADLVVAGIGAIPNTEWLEGSGVELENGVVCDATLASSVPGVYAAGDVASWVNPVFDRRQRLEHWTSAAEQGAIAARNALDPANPTAYRTVPYFWSDWYDVRIQFVGTPQADEVLLVDGDPDAGERWVALYRSGDRLVGALTVNGQTEIMKYRGKILKGATWDDALAFADQRKEARAAAATGG